MTTHAAIGATAEPGLATRAETQVVRVITAVFGVAAVVFLALAVGPIVQQSRYLSPLSLGMMIAVVFATPVVIAVASPLLTLSALRVAHGTYFVAYSAVLVAWVPALTEYPMPIETSPWPLGVLALGTVPAALTWRPTIAWTLLVLSSALLGVVRYFAAGRVNIDIPIQDAIYSVAFSGIFTALAMVALRSARALDRITTIERATAARVASTAARLREQSRLDALVHDEVMSALYYASKGGSELDATVRAQAARALSQVSSIETDAAASSAPGSMDDFSIRLRSTVASLDDSVRYSITGARAASIPADVVAAFVEATSEAVRNSLIHAQSGPRDVQRSVQLALSEATVTVRIVDDGIGFEPTAVPPQRLGILLSIRHRLSLVDGGSAKVESALGRGTAVTLTWCAP
ncbi:MAG: ATP-binding protein [Salinibacterium sp.]|nr:ATP-binding protein [Salinibacterium sp.]